MTFCHNITLFEIKAQANFISQNGNAALPPSPPASSPPCQHQRTALPDWQNKLLLVSSLHLLTINTCSLWDVPHLTSVGTLKDHNVWKSQWCFELTTICIEVLQVQMYTFSAECPYGFWRYSLGPSRLLGLQPQHRGSGYPQVPAYFLSTLFKKQTNGQLS